MTTFLITTFLRDSLLYKSVESLLPYLGDNAIIIVDQGHLTDEKEQWLDKYEFDAINYSRKNNPQKRFYYQVPYDSGLSFCRNYGIQMAKELGSEYVVIGSDSFLFNETIGAITSLTFDGYDLAGFELDNCTCGWEGKLNLIEGEAFELDFIDKSKKKLYYNVDICRNFFIAKTDSLFNSPWDNNLKLQEHELFFYNYKKNGYKCIWTPIIVAEKLTERPNEYSSLRQKNINDGRKYLQKLLGIKKWVIYKNLDRAKEQN